MKKIAFLLSIVAIFSFQHVTAETINNEDFEDGTLGTWGTYDVLGDNNWYASDYTDGTKYAKISGYSGGNVANEDWLISPEIDFTANAPVAFSFMSATANYDGADLEVLVSINYDGFSDPNTATWTTLSASLSNGDYAWVASGNIDLSSYSGNGYIAFKYTSTTTAGKIWELDDLLITGTGSGNITPPSDYNDTITIMQYNLLAYTTGTYITCDQTNNSVIDKDAYIKTITQSVKPDIFTVNEISKTSADHDRLKTNCLNVEGVSDYKRANISNTANSWVINQMFYRSDKFTLYSQDAILGNVRDINVYKLKYNKKDDDGNDIYLTCIVAHLKAGETETIARADATADIMSYISTLSNNENVLVMGDFNVYSSTETCFQNMIAPSNSSITMNDPINKLGDWNNSGAFASIHTQSTHSTDNGCASTGGMDDRFDFILASNDIMNGTSKVEYITSSYKAVGQDGLHYNDDLNSYPDNGVVSIDVANALYYNSDHLPVTLKLKMKTGTSSIDDLNSVTGLNFNFTNPASNNLDLTIENFKNYYGNVSVNIYSIVGQKIASKNIELNLGISQYSINLNNAKSGLYIVRITDKDNNSKSEKLIIK